MVDETPVGLELRFTRTAHADAASELLEVRPHSRESRQHVLELSELDLKLCLARSRSRREDVEDQLGAIHHALACRVLDVLALRRCQLIVEDDERRLRVGDERRELVDLALAEIRRRVGSIDLLRETADDDRTSRVRQFLELVEMVVDVMARRGAFPRRADQ